MVCLALEMAQFAVTAFGLEVFDAFLDILLAPSEQGLDEPGDLVRGCLDRAGRVEPSQARTVTGADEALEDTLWP